MLTSDRTIRWIENIAEQERSIKSGERSSVDLCMTKDDVLSIETHGFLEDVHQHFEYLIKLFNSRVEKNELQIQLSQNLGDPQGFTCLRNDVKLVVSTPKLGSLHFQCHKRVLIGENEPIKSSMMFSGAIEAKFGKFHDVEWYFLDSWISSEQAAKHYLTEFIQISRQVN